MVRRFIIDTDAGLDDASALFLAAEAHKAGVIDILGITTVHGNTKLENVIVNVARTLKAAGLNHVIPKVQHPSIFT
jgi:inosine-uridine nucleoside N-ribohydrolase